MLQLLCCFWQGTATPCFTWMTFRQTAFRQITLLISPLLPKISISTIAVVLLFGKSSEKCTAKMSRSCNSLVGKCFSKFYEISVKRKKRIHLLLRWKKTVPLSNNKRVGTSVQYVVVYLCQYLYLLASLFLQSPTSVFPFSSWSRRRGTWVRHRRLLKGSLPLPLPVDGSEAAEAVGHAGVSAKVYLAADRPCTAAAAAGVQ